MSSALGPPIGWEGPFNLDRTVFNRTGAARINGDLVQLDIGLTQAETTNTEVGDDASGLANAVTPAAGFVEHGIFGVVFGGGGADDTRIRVRLRGIVNELSVNAATARTDQLVPTATTHAATPAGVSTSKIIGIPLSTTAGAGLVSALFDGINGFGKAT